MNKTQNRNLVTRTGQRIHIIHDRENNQTVGYTVTPTEDGRNVQVYAARSVCANQDNFCKKVANGIVKSRLDAGPKGSNQHRVFTSTIAVAEPSNASEWRELDQTVVGLIDLKLTPADRVRAIHND